MNNIFSGLEELGFKNLDNIDLYKTEDNNNSSKDVIVKKEPSPEDFLYDKSYTCPVCQSNFKARTVKVGKARLASKDTDLMPRYDGINPLFYDVIVCTNCGYSALSKYFNNLKDEQASLIRSKISVNYKPKTYPNVYDIDIAVERYKLALLNAVVKNGKNSEKAYICLKLAWLYRLKHDKVNELRFIEQAFIGFKESFEREIFPICGMDANTLMYLIGELARRLGRNQEALQWFGRVITGRNVNSRLKDLAREQKNLIKEQGA